MADATDAGGPRKVAGHLWRAILEQGQPLELLTDALSAVKEGGGTLVRCDIYSNGFLYKLPLNTANPLIVGPNEEEVKWPGLMILFMKENHQE